MKARDLAHHVEAEAGATVARRQPIERFEDQRALVGGYPVAFIRDAERRGQADLDGDGAPPAAMLDRVLHEVGQCAFQACMFAHRLDAFGSVVERQLVAGGNRKRRKIRSHALRDRHQVDARGRVLTLIEPLDIEQLLGHRREPCAVLDQAGLVRAGRQRFQPRVQDRDRRAQLVRGIRNETLVARIAFVEARQRVVDGADQRHGLERNGVRGQADAAFPEVDLARLVRSRIKSGEGSLHHHWRCDRGGGRHHQQAGKSDAQKCQGRGERSLAARHFPLGGGENLHGARVAIDTFQPRGRLAWAVVEELPAQPCLTDLVEGTADSGKF